MSVQENPEQQQSAGNYRSYYSKRRLDDNRISKFKSEWFTNLKCLDVGCNSGVMTMEIAKQFNPSSIVGIDNDEKLVFTAQKLLESTAKSALTSVSITTLLPRSMAAANKKGKLNDVARFPGNVSFMHRDLMSLLPDQLPGFQAPASSSSSSKNLADINPATHPHAHARAQREAKQFSSGAFDSVLCLSISKWIHLYYGDTGLILLFALLNNLMASTKTECASRSSNSGGVLVLEYQPWSSYIKNKSRSDTTKKNFGRIRIKPVDFVGLLTTHFGFAVVAHYGGCGSGSGSGSGSSSCCDHSESVGEGKGFDRPVLVLRKQKHIPIDTASLQSMLRTIIAAYDCDTVVHVVSAAEGKRKRSDSVEEEVHLTTTISQSSSNEVQVRLGVKNSLRTKTRGRKCHRRQSAADGDDDDEFCAYSRHILTDSEGEAEEEKDSGGGRNTNDDGGSKDGDGDSDNDEDEKCREKRKGVGKQYSAAASIAPKSGHKHKSILARAMEKTSRRREKKIMQLELVELRTAVFTKTNPKFH